MRHKQTRICTADSENGKRNHVTIRIDLEIEVLLWEREKSGKLDIFGSTTRNIVLRKKNWTFFIMSRGWITTT